MASSPRVLLVTLVAGALAACSAGATPDAATALDASDVPRAIDASTGSDVAVDAPRADAPADAFASDVTPSSDGRADADAPDDAPIATVVPSIMGCAIGTAGDLWNADITSAAVDPGSAQYVAAVGAAGDTTGFYATTDLFALNIAGAGTPRIATHDTVTYHRLPPTVPWTAGFYYEHGGGAVLDGSPANGDDDLFVLDTSSCEAFELYNAQHVGAVENAYSGETYHTTDTNAGSPASPSQSSASHLPHLPLSLRYEEVAAGSVRHAIGFTLWAQTPCNCYEAPATGTDGLAYTGSAPESHQLPYGAHLRLRADYHDARCSTAAVAVLSALQHYGMYLTDTGGRYADNNALWALAPIAHPSSSSWPGLDLGCLSDLRVADFSVLTVGTKHGADGGIVP